MLKGAIKPDHIPVNKYVMSVVALLPLTFTEISGIEEETDVIDLPDRTRASGGNSQPFEFTVMQPMHHTAEVAAMEVWFQEGKDPVTPTFKKPVTLRYISGTGAIERQYAILGAWVSKRKLPDLSMENEGEMAQIEWTFQADSLLPL